MTKRITLRRRVSCSFPNRRDWHASSWDRHWFRIKCTPFSTNYCNSCTHSELAICWYSPARLPMNSTPSNRPSSCIWPMTHSKRHSVNILQAPNGMNIMRRSFMVAASPWNCGNVCWRRNFQCVCCSSMCPKVIIGLMPFNLLNNWMRCRQMDCWEMIRAWKCPYHGRRCTETLQPNNYIEFIFFYLGLMNKWINFIIIGILSIFLFSLWIDAVDWDYSWLVLSELLI